VPFEKDGHFEPEMHSRTTFGSKPSPTVAKEPGKDKEARGTERAQPFPFVDQSSSPNSGGQKFTSQSTSSRFLRKTQLQELLERIFPEQTDFNIQVSLLIDCVYITNRMLNNE
jgi:hypothetical protein